MKEEIKKKLLDTIYEALSQITADTNIVVAVQRKQGEYEGRTYDNVVLTTLKKFPLPNGDFVCGVEHIKIKKSLFDTMPCAVGDCIFVSYNRFGSVQDLRKI